MEQSENVKSSPINFGVAFSDKRSLITGGLGFIGSNLARWLVRLGAHVTLVDSLLPEYGGNLFNIAGIESQVQVNIADVRDRYSMKCLVQGHDYLFNLAGQTSHCDSMVNPYVDMEINCCAQLSILEACRHHNPDIKVIFTSTRQVYGVPRYLPVDEQHPLCPVDINGINKLSGEWYHIVYNKVYGIRTCVLRLTNTYGPRMRVKDARQSFLGIWLRRLIERQPIDIFGDGSQMRDLSYVDDVVTALLLAAASEEANGQVFNLGDDTPISLLDLANLLIEIDGGGEYRLVPFPPERKIIDIGSYYADFHLIRAQLGWKPRFSLHDGLEHTLRFYHEHCCCYW